MESGNGRSDKAHFRGIAAARAVTCVRGFAYVGQSMGFDCALLRPGHSVGMLFEALLEPRLDVTGAALRRREKGSGAQNGSAATSRSFS